MSLDRSTTTIVRAAAVGAVCGLRTFTAPAILAANGSWGDGAPARLLPAAGVGELVADKLPMMPPRSDPPAFAGRVLSGAACGWTVSRLAGKAGVPATVAGALAAAASIVPSQKLRAALGRRTGVADPLLAIAEDLLAVGVVLAVTHGLTGA